MIEISNKEGLKEFLERKHALLFLFAPWSRYSRISKELVENIETHFQASQQDIHFYFGVFEEDLVYLAAEVCSLGVPDVSFTGAGAIAFFKKGKYLGHVRSVVGEGTDLVYKKISEFYSLQ